MTVSLVGKGKISWLCRTVKVFFHIKQQSNAVQTSFLGNSSTGISPCSIEFKHFFAVGFQLSTVRDWRLFCVVLFSYWKRREKVFGKWMNYFGYKQSECWTLLSFVAAKCAFCLTNWLHFCQVRPREIVGFHFFHFWLLLWELWPSSEKANNKHRLESSDHIDHSKNKRVVRREWTVW